MSDQIYFFTRTDQHPETVVERDGLMVAVYPDGTEEVGAPLHGLEVAEPVTPPIVRSAAPEPSLEDAVTLVWRTRAAGPDGERTRGPVHIITPGGAHLQTLCGNQLGRYLTSRTISAHAGEATCRVCITEHLAGTRRAWTRR